MGSTRKSLPGQRRSHHGRLSGRPLQVQAIQTQAGRRLGLNPAARVGPLTVTENSRGWRVMEQPPARHWVSARTGAGQAGLGPGQAGRWERSSRDANGASGFPGHAAVQPHQFVNGGLPTVTEPERNAAGPAGRVAAGRVADPPARRAARPAGTAADAVAEREVRRPGRGRRLSAADPDRRGLPSSS